MKPGFPIEVIRTNRRKTATVKVAGNRLQVTVSRNLSERWVDDLMRRKSSWIREKLLVQSQCKPLESKQYVPGGSFSYLGKTYTLGITGSGRVEPRLRAGNKLVIGVDNNLPVERRANHVNERLVYWYAERAAHYLAEKTAYHARRVDVSPATVRVKDYKSRWGCCSVRGEIFYNWRIIMAPARIVGYVII